MKLVEIKDAETLVEILEVFSFLDDARWKKKFNYNLLNFYRGDMSAAEKLLVHWLCYIMDRQMPFQPIWEVGGYVVSHIVSVFSEKPRKPVWQSVLKPFLKSDKRGNLFLAAPGDENNRILSRYEQEDNEVRFKSRYMPEDVLLIYRTLGILDKVASRSFARFIVKALKKAEDHASGIRLVASALDSLTYCAGGAVRRDEFEERRKVISKEIAGFSFDPDERDLSRGRKRLWCSIRDYLKSPEYNAIFVSALAEAGFSQAGEWKRNSKKLRTALHALELPGDVWNNLPTIREGIFSPYLANEPKSASMPVLIRQVFDELRSEWEISFYPEQLDVTFDFAPRMCERRMCNVCPFGGGVEKICHEKKGVLCPVVLLSCGYLLDCSPAGCRLAKNNTAGFCKTAIT